MAEVIGCGIDIEELARFNKNATARSEIPGFAHMVYTPAEIETNQLIHPRLTFPLCFSCKEAVFKSFGVSWTNSRITWKDIELLFLDKNDLNNYNIRLNGYAGELYSEMKCSKLESFFTYTDKYVLFRVILHS